MKRKLSALFLIITIVTSVISMTSCAIIEDFVDNIFGEKADFLTCEHKYGEYYGSYVCELCDAVSPRVFSYELLEDDTYKISTNFNFEAAQEKLVFNIPENYNGKQVSTISKSLMNYLGGIATLYIPKTIRLIESGSGSHSNLKNILVDRENQCYYSKNNCLIEAATGALILGCNDSVIPNGVKSIGSYAFSGCDKLKRVKIPDSVTSIGKRAFSSCVNLSNVEIGGGVESIGEEAFYYCTNLNRITLKSNSRYYVSGNCLIDKETKTLLVGTNNSVIPYGVRAIGAGAFSGHDQLRKIDIPDSVVEIRLGAFIECVQLKTINLPEGIETISSAAFYGCSNLENVIIPNSVSRIESSAFGGCSNLENVIIPNGVSCIASGTFSGCEKITNIVIPDNITRIEHLAFGYCTSLRSVSIGKNVSSIGTSAFDGCNLDSIIVDDENTHYYVEGNCLIGETLDASGKIGEEIVYEHNITLIAGTNKSIIPDSVTKIAETAFSGRKSLSSIVIPDGVTKIGRSAFSECTNLSTVEIRGEVDSLSSTFENCKNLKNVNISGSVASIGGAFGGCTSLEKIKLPYGVTCIGSSSFYGCTNLYDIDIPDSITSISRDAFTDTAFYNDEKNWENDVLYIGNHLISARTTISGDYAVREGTVTIAECAFIGCDKLTSITIPNSVVSIGEERSTLLAVFLISYIDLDLIDFGVFSHCSSLLKVTFEEGSRLNSIGRYAFNNCKSLVNFTIPDSVTHIGEGAFIACDSLTDVTFENPTGWKCSGWNTDWNAGLNTDLNTDLNNVLNNDVVIPEGLSNSRTAAKYLTSDYALYRWSRE